MDGDNLALLETRHCQRLLRNVNPASDLAENLELEKNDPAQGSVLDDPFRDCHLDVLGPPPRTPLKVEKDVNTTNDLLPPTTALPSLIYLSETLNDSYVSRSISIQSVAILILMWARWLSDRSMGPWSKGILC